MRGSRKLGRPAGRVSLLTEGRFDVVPGYLIRPGTPGVPGDDAAALRAENGRLREANERLRALLEEKDAKIAELGGPGRGWSV
jgi:hypothetical protein